MIVVVVFLEEDQVLETNSWVEWLSSIPNIIRFANVEGIYKSDSTLLILSIPVAVWDLLPESPAISFIGFVRSVNQLGTSLLLNKWKDRPITLRWRSVALRLLNSPIDLRWRSLASRLLSRPINGGVCFPCQVRGIRVFDHYLMLNVI